MGGGGGIANNMETRGRSLPEIQRTVNGFMQMIPKMDHSQIA